MTSILGIEHYTLIMLGAITVSEWFEDDYLRVTNVFSNVIMILQEYPMLHTPWLLMQLCVIIVELIVFCVKMFLDGLHLKRDEILLAVLTVHNWLQVFCLFHRQARQSRWTYNERKEWKLILGKKIFSLVEIIVKFCNTYNKKKKSYTTYLKLQFNWNIIWQFRLFINTSYIYMYITWKTRGYNLSI